MDRNSAREIKVKGKIIELIGTNDGVYCYTPISVWKIRSPEGIDLDGIYPNMPFESSIFRKSGTRSTITARIIIQSKRLLNQVDGRIDRWGTIFQYLMGIETNLLACNRIFKNIKSKLIKLRTKKIRIANGVANKIPSIDELDVKLYFFMNCAKQAQQLVVMIYNEFHQTEFDGPDIGKLLKDMEEKEVSAEDEISFMKNYKDFYKLLVDIRNAQEHPNKTRYLKIENYMIVNDKEISEPKIKYFNNKLITDTYVENWMQNVIEGLVQLVEVQIIYGVKQISKQLGANVSPIITFIPEENRDKECPVEFEMQLKLKNSTTVVL